MAGFVGSPDAFELPTDDWCLNAQRFKHFLQATGVENDSE